MKKCRIPVLACVSLLALVTACQKIERSPNIGTTAPVTAAERTTAQPTDCSQGGGCIGSTCLTTITSSAAALPTDACPKFGEEHQGSVDVFSWNSFIALNWPATTQCTADTSRSILEVTSGAQGPVVWQTQMASGDVFVSPESKPAVWCQGSSTTALFKKQPQPMKNIAKAASSAHALGDTFAAIAQPTGVEAFGGVVTDQSGRWLRYERYMNQVEYNAVVQNSWYKLSVLNGLPSITLPTGSVELKAAWKVLTSQEIASSRYYTTVATVYNSPDEKTSPGPNPVTLGLVGLHIIQKTPSEQGFFWSTFEHIDNETVFFNRSSNTAPNTQTATPPFIEFNSNGSPRITPTQIKRVNSVAANPALNAYYQNLLGDSVFRFYRLISTQWQFGTAPQGSPPNVANIVIETYVQSVSVPLNPRQADGPQVTGCLACHINATAANKTTSTDTSFLFLEAK